MRLRAYWCCHAIHVSQVERVLNHLLTLGTQALGPDDYWSGSISLKVISVRRVENLQYWDRFNTERHVIARQVAAYLEKNYCSPQNLVLDMMQQCQKDLSSLGAPRLMNEANEVYLFHGSASIMEISQTGFEVKMAGSNAGSVYGRGIYFASKVSSFLRFQVALR